MSERERFLEWYKEEFCDERGSRPIAWAAWQAACPEGWQCVPKEPTGVGEIISKSPLNDVEEVAIQSFLVDFNTHANPSEFEATGVNGYFQWWRARRSAAPKPGDL